MSKEKAIILQMVESGKISVDDAVKLIEAIKSDEYGYGYERTRFWDSAEFEEKLSRFSSSAENMAKDISAKVNETWKDVEPKFKSATKKAVEKTVKVIDKVSESLSDSLKNFDGCSSDDGDCNENDSSDKNDDEPREN